MLWKNGLLTAVVFAFVGTAFAFAKEPADIPQIEVVGEFGDASQADIAALLKSTAAELAKFLPHRREDVIRVAYSQEGPIVLYDRGPNREYQVRLNVQGRFWSQFAYQFAHEHCHILCNYRAGRNPNKWFEESLCELASIFVVRKMSDTWQKNPPYPNWKEYHQSLADYIQKHTADKGLPEGKTLAAWYVENAAELRKTATDRPRNQVVALALVPLFEREPEHWLTVESLNAKPSTEDQSLADYLQNWETSTPAKGRAFVAKIASELGIKLKPTAAE